MNKDLKKNVFFISSFVLYLGILLLIMQLRSDGYYPFPKTWPEDRLLLIVLPHTILLALFIIRYAFLLVSQSEIKTFPIKKKWGYIFFGTIPLIAMVLICKLHIMQADYFKPVGYTMDFEILFAFVGLAIFPMLGYWCYVLIKKRFFPALFLMGVLLSSIILKFIPLFLFPITAKRSDLLPIVEEAAKSILRGEHIYRYYLLDNNIMTQNVRLFGLVFLFLPAVIFQLDIRLTTIFFEFVMFLTIFFSIPKTHRIQAGRQTTIILSILFFAFLPYWHYRHELYEIPFWFLTFLTLLFLNRKAFWPAFLLTGLMIGTHQWGWLFAPFILIHIFLHNVLKHSLLGGMIAVLLGWAIIMMGSGLHWHEFYQHIFGTYEITLQVRVNTLSMYFTPFFLKNNLTFLLHPIQLTIQIFLMVLVFKKGDKTESLAGILALSLTGMLLFNVVAWTYQYLLVSFLLFLGTYFRSIREAEESLF